MFKNLYNFVAKRMRMSHIYQPLMLITLLENSGVATDTEIAKNLLLRDESQLDYYRNITNRMVGRVLLGHGLVERKKETKTYHLLGYEQLSEDDKGQLIALCREKLLEFLDKRGKSVYRHRRLASGYISGTLRYGVLKRARFRCELCGISAYEKALEVDHILPRSLGGADDLANLQALCYTCNTNKSNRDQTDFRFLKDSYDVRAKDCLFCELPPARIIAENRLGFLILDNYPVTPLHQLIIPKRHVDTYFDLGQAEINACTELLHQAKEQSQRNDQTISGFNIGVNNGESAGQTVMHCHIHLIPRRMGDVENPRGGIRHVIADKGIY